MNIFFILQSKVGYGETGEETGETGVLFVCNSTSNVK